MASIEIKLFAGLAERVGCRVLSLDDGRLPATVGELEQALRSRCPALAGCSFRVAVNRGYAVAATPLAPGDEVALIPPVSGG